MSDTVHTLGQKQKLQEMKNMIQTELAGDFITRTMLSKVENGAGKSSSKI